MRACTDPSEGSAEPLPPPPSTLETKKTQFFESIKKTAFVVGTALIVFAAARNSIVWHLQRFWGASADFWQWHWAYMYREWFKESEFNIFVIGTFIVTNLAFWSGNLFLIFLDLTGRPAFLLKYKIQEEENVPLDRKKLRRALLQVLFNIFIVGMPCMYTTYILYTWRGVSVTGDLPTFQWVLFEIFIFTLVEEVAFYYSHRGLHHPAIYKYIHKRHHEWTAPIGIIALYAHPIEHILSNMVPPMLGPLIMGSHLGTAWLWFCVALLSTTISHCGYHFPLLPSPEAHDFHHLKFTNNFGVLGVLDRLHGTDNMFRASKQYQRHILLLGMTPLSQQVPFEKNGKKAKKED